MSLTQTIRNFLSRDNFPSLLRLQFFTVCFGVCIAQTSFSSDSPPNIIVVFADDQGWADLGVHGVVEDVRTPNLDALADSGVRFTDGYVTAPQCIPSRAGLLSGTYQQYFGVDDNRYAPMPETVVTLPERLQALDYRTGLVGKWHLDPTGDSEDWLRTHNYAGQPLPPRPKRSLSFADRLPYLPGNQGFDHFFAGYIWNYEANFDLEGNSLGNVRNLRIEGDDRLDIQTQAALTFIERNRDQPFFLYLAYFAPHVPLASSEKYLSRFPGEMPERRRYALAMLSAVDEGVGRIRRQLEEDGLLENTLFFYISDNGAPLSLTMPDAPVDAPGGGWDGSLNTPLRGEKGMLTEGGIRVPFLMSWPGHIPSGQVSKLPVSTLDVAATALASAGVEPPPELAGKSIPQLLAHPEQAQERPLFWRFWGQGAVRLGDWKYLHVGELEYLFNVSEDPTESLNRIDEQPQRAAELRQQWAVWDQRLQRPFDGGVGKRNEQEERWYKYFFKTIH